MQEGDRDDASYRKQFDTNCSTLLELASSDGWNLDGEKLGVKVYSKYKPDDPIVCLKVFRNCNFIIQTFFLIFFFHFHVELDAQSITLIYYVG